LLGAYKFKVPHIGHPVRLVTNDDRLSFNRYPEGHAPLLLRAEPSCGGLVSCSCGLLARRFGGIIEMRPA